MELEDISTYEPPEILDDMDEEEIHARVLETIPDSIDKMEGGFVYDFTMPPSMLKADIMVRINEMVKLFFPEWSYGEMLDRHARNVGLSRRSATAAETTLTVTGTEGTVIPAGKVFSTSATLISENIEFTSTEEVTIPEGGTAYVPVLCSQTGTVGNVPANCIIMEAEATAGIDEVTNPVAATGGTEEEDDENLRTRIMAVDRSGELSYVGNDSDYIRWAQEVDGVGSVIVISEWEGAGTGTVKLIVMDLNGAPATQTILDNVYDHIMAPDDPTARLANTEVILTVETATPLYITVAATVQLADDATIEDATADFTSKLRTYFEEAKADGSLRYTRVGRELSESTGIEDYSSLTVNSGTGNVTIAADRYPVIQTITLTAAE